MNLIINVWLSLALVAYICIGTMWYTAKDVPKSSKMFGLFTVVPILSLGWPFVLWGLLMG